MSVKGTPGSDYVYTYQLRKIRIDWLTGKVKLGLQDKRGDLSGVVCTDNSDFESDISDYGNSADDEDDWPIKAAFLEPEDFGSQLPGVAFEKQEVNNGHGGKYLLVKAKTD